jgi:hypothetical protein
MRFSLLAALLLFTALTACGPIPEPEVDQSSQAVTQFVDQPGAPIYICYCNCVFCLRWDYSQPGQVCLQYARQNRMSGAYCAAGTTLDEQQASALEQCRSACQLFQGTECVDPPTTTFWPYYTC